MTDTPTLRQIEGTFAAEATGIDLARPLLMGRVPDGILVHIAVLLAYSIVAYYAALVLTRRRLLK